MPLPSVCKSDTEGLFGSEKKVTQSCDWITSIFVLSLLSPTT